MNGSASARLALVVAALAVVADIGLARIGYGLVLPAIRRDLGGSYALYGAVAAVHLGGYLAGTLATPALLRTRERLPRITALAHVAVAVFVIASAFATSVFALAAARLAIGVASGFGIASALTDALERVEPQRRGFASAIAWSTTGLALVVSSPAGAWTLHEAARWRVATALWAVPAVLVAVLAWRLAPQTHHEEDPGEDRPFRWLDLLRRSNLFFVASYAAFGLAYIAFVTFAVSAFAARGIAPNAVTAIWASCGIAAACGALAVGRVLSSAAHRWSLAIPMLCGGVGCLAANLPGAAGAAAGTIFVGLGLAATPAVASAFARERSDRATAARAFAAVTTVFGVGQLAGPLIAGAIADHFGLSAVPVYAGCVFLAGAVAAAIDATR